MATKENQGLQAGVIVLAILVIAMGVGLLLVNNAKKTAQARADDAGRQMTDARTAAAEAQAEANTYKEWIGFDEGAALDALRQAFEEDQARFMANMEEGSRNYSTALDVISEENRKLVANESKAKQDVQDLNARLLAVEAQKEAQVEEAQAALKKAADDLAAQKAKFDEFRAQMQAEKDKIAAEMEALRAAHDETKSEFAAEKTSLTNEIGRLERSIDELRRGLPTVDQFAQPADGEIRWVNQRHGKVWIDLGSADGLRPQVTFKVAALNDSDVQDAESKGTIEVVRILDDHMAEARITSDEPTNPLMVGDRIYSLVWDRGRQVGFAIAGEIDIDGDGESDLERLKNIITASNGRIDAAPDETGALKGEINVDTRYLVLGEHPDSPRDQKLRESWQTMSQDAERLGVETIGLEEFLRLIGWQLDSRTVAMGAAASGIDFPPQPREQQLPPDAPQPTGAFRRVPTGVNY